MYVGVVEGLVVGCEVKVGELEGDDEIVGEFEGAWLIVGCAVGVDVLGDIVGLLVDGIFDDDNVGCGDEVVVVAEGSCSLVGSIMSSNSINVSKSSLSLSIT